jgi:hypothetical protein
MCVYVHTRSEQGHARYPLSVQNELAVWNTLSELADSLSFAAATADSEADLVAQYRQNMEHVVNCFSLACTRLQAESMHVDVPGAAEEEDREGSSDVDMSMEIERRFVVTPEAWGRVIEAAQALMTGSDDATSVKMMRDSYYDTHDWVLTRRDWWLRERSGMWELKVPVVPVEERLPGAILTADRYHEYVGDEAVTAQLVHVLTASGDAGPVPHRIVERLVCFATLETHRKSYELALDAVGAHDGLLRRLGVDMDLVTAEEGSGEWQYSVVEIEALASQDADAARVASFVDAVAVRIGLADGTPVCAIFDCDCVIVWKCTTHRQRCRASGPRKGGRVSRTAPSAAFRRPCCCRRVSREAVVGEYGVDACTCMYVQRW